MTLDPVTKQLAAAAFATIAIVAGYAYFLYEIRAQITVVNELAQEVEREAAREETLREMANVVSDIADERNQLDTYFLDEDEVVALLEAFEGLGSTTGAQIEVRSVSNAQRTGGTRSFSPAGGQAEGDTHQVVRLAIVAEGAFSSVFHTLALLERFPLPIVIEEVGLSRGGAGGAQPQWSAAIGLSVVRQPS